MTTAIARILDDVRLRGALQTRDIANILDVSVRTVAGWSNGRATPQLRTQTVIADLRYTVDRLSDFYAPDEIRVWLHARHPLLNGERPIDLLADKRTEQVLAVVEQLEAGAYL